MTSKKQTTAVEPEAPELTPAVIAAREAEKTALLALIKARPKDDAPILDPEDAPAETAARSSSDVAAEIEREKAEHQKATEAAEFAHKERIAKLVADQQRASAAEARRPDASVQARLRAATDAVAGPVVDTAARVAAQERAELQKQVDKVVKDARESLAQFEEIWEEHGDEIERLAQVPDKEMLRGLPAEGHDAGRGYGLAVQITEHVGEIQDFVKNSPRAFESLIRDVQGLVQHAPLPANRDSARYQAWQAEFRGAMRDLGRMSGAVPALNGRISNLSLLVSDLAAIRKQYAGSAAASKEIETDNPGKFFRGLDQPNPRAPKPDRYDTNYDIFTTGR